METMDSLKRHIGTASDLHSLVRTMKALAAVNIRQLEHAVNSLADYSRTIELGLRVVLRRHRVHRRLASKPAIQAKLGVIIIGSDQGMCGPMNEQIVAHAFDELEASSLLSRDRVFMTVGERIATRLEDAGNASDALLLAASSTSGITPLVQDILLQIDNWHSQHAVNRIVVFYCEHLSRASYRPQTLHLLPLDRAWLQELESQKWPSRVLPTFTMDRDVLFSSLVRQYLFVSLYRACAESMASENASRLTAMRGAERNIGDRITDLTKRFHQQRQMSITEELLDIASGFEALEVIDY